MNTFVRNPYNYDTNEASEQSALYCTDGTRTQQNFKAECDINFMLKKFGVAGLPAGARIPEYGDFSGITDYHSAMNAVIDAKMAFDALPSAVRKRFGNDAGAFVDFCADERNREELVDMGLIEPQKAVQAAESSVSEGGEPSVAQ